MKIASIREIDEDGLEIVASDEIPKLCIALQTALDMTRVVNERCLALLSQ